MLKRLMMLLMLAAGAIWAQNLPGQGTYPFTFDWFGGTMAAAWYCQPESCDSSVEVPPGTLGEAIVGATGSCYSGMYPNVTLGVYAFCYNPVFLWSKVTYQS